MRQQREKRTEDGEQEVVIQWNVKLLRMNR